jgi:hypothetical protein
MNDCGHYQGQLLDHLYDLLEGDESRALTEHLRTCGACRSALTRVEARRVLLAAAAKTEFPGVQFQAPPAVDEGRTLPFTRRAGSRWRWAPWAVAASVLLALGGLAAWYGVDYGRNKDRVAYLRGEWENAVALLHNQTADHDAAVAKAEQHLQAAPAKQQRLAQELETKFAAIDERYQANQVKMVITGPPTIQFGAPTEYHIETKNLNDQLVPAQLEARVRDDADHEVYKKTAIQSTGRYVLALPANLPVKSDARLYLEVVAKDVPVAEDRPLRQKLSLVDPVFVTHLTTDKPMYHPGEVVYFRSLTLDRLTLKPADEHLNLIYTITPPTGNPEVILAGGDRITGRRGHATYLVRGPDQQPIRGIGCGAYTIDPGAAGGEYVLTVTDANHRFPPEKRKFIVNEYRPPKLNKKLDFARKSYGPGELVEATCHVSRAEGGQAVARRPVLVTVRIDDKEYGADGQVVDAGNPIHFETDATGTVKIAFRLPNEIRRGDASVTVHFDDGANSDSIVRPIPIVLKDLQVEFFPEGGWLVAGTSNRVYFEARTMLDKPAELRGRLLDAAGKVVATLPSTIETLNDAEQPGVNQGMGRFEFTPAAGMQYALKIDSPAGVAKTFALPPVKNEGVVLQVPDGVTTDKDALRVTVTSPDRDRTLLVGAYCRGRLMAYDRVQAARGEAATVALKPAGGMGGVYRVTVFEEGAPGPDGHRGSKYVAERLVYRMPAERVNVTVKPDKSSYVPGDKATLYLTARNEKGEAVPAILLVAVTDLSVVTLADEKTARSMPTHFFLTSEVRRPEDLEYADFLLSDHPKAKPALDLLLGTQGWRRFAEQKKQQFHEEYKEDADRLLVLEGQLTPEDKQLKMRSAADAEKEQVRAAFKSKLDQANDDYLDAELALENAQEAQGVFQAAEVPGLKAAVAETKASLEAEEGQLRQREENLHRLGTLALLVLGTALVIAIVMGIAVGVLRGLTGAIPYLAAGTAFAVVVLGVVALLVVGHQPAQPRSAQTAEGAKPPAPAAQVQMQEKAAAEPQAPRALPGFAPQPQLGGAAVKGGFPPPGAAPGAGVIRNGGGFGGGRPGAAHDGRFDHFALDKAKGEGKGQGKDGGLAIAADRQLGGPGRGPMMARPVRPIAARGVARRGEARKRLREAAEKPPEQLRIQMKRLPDALDEDRADEWGEVPTPLPIREYAHQHATTSSGARSDFAETLYWQPVLVLPEDGQTQVAFDLGDSVTRFQVAVAAHTLDGRLGAMTTTFASRLPFSVEPKLPMEVTVGDLVEVPVTVSNDTSDLRWVSVRVEARGMDLVTGTGEERRQLRANERARLVFRFRPTLTGLVDGQARLTFIGNSEPFATDTVEHSVRVVRSGFPVLGAQSDVLEKSASNEIVLPETWVPGTLQCRVQVYPSTLADLQKGLEAMLQEPCGCFEQTSTSNYPNLLILNYLQESNQANAEAEKRARELLDRGYQKLVSFECKVPGANAHRGYEWFGGEAPPHEALTAYGLLQFRDMARVYQVDQEMVERTREYLMKQKDGKGGFRRNDRALDTFGRAPEDITNAYIVWALTESGKKDDVEKELAALTKQAHSSTDAYFLALVANSLYNRDQADEGLALLKKLAEAQKEDGHLDGARTSITGSAGRDLQIETTALTVLAWLKAGRLSPFNTNVRKSIDWIGRQRGGYGGFGATQSTILALKALIAFAKENKKTAEAGELSLYVGDKRVGEPLQFAAGHQDALTLELPEAERWLKPGKNRVRVEITTKQGYPYTLSWSYRTAKPASGDKCPIRLTTTLSGPSAAESSSVRLTATVENQSDDQNGQGMTVAIIGLPGGLKLPEDMVQLKERRDQKVISAWEVRGRELILYWRALGPKQKIEVKLDLICAVPGTYSGPASRAYLYYNADQKCWVDPLQIEIKERRPAE